jgi:hypothetical protein
LGFIGTAAGTENKLKTNLYSPGFIVGIPAIFHSSISRAVFPASDDSNWKTREMLLISDGLR